MSRVPGEFVPDDERVIEDLPVCPGCDDEIGPGALQHNAVTEHGGSTWHRSCLYDDLDLERAETGRRCPRCYGVSRYVPPDEETPTAKRLCPCSGVVYDDGAVVETEADR